MQINEITESKQQLDEFIPLAIMGAGAVWTAYDAWQMKRAYDRGEISGADVAKAVGTDIAATIIGGVVAKVVGKGWKYGKKIFGSKKAAQDAAMANAAKTVNARSQSKDLVVPPKPLDGDILPPVVKQKQSKSSQRRSQPVGIGPRAKPGEQEIKPPGGVFYKDVENAFDKLSQEEEARELMKILTKPRSAAAKMKTAAEKAQKLAKYKETGDVEHLRGLGVSAVYQAGGKKALKALGKNATIAGGKKGSIK